MAEPVAPPHQRAAPSAAVLDYLGRYADAADGLDPLGFAASDTDSAPGDGGKQP